MHVRRGRYLVDQTINNAGEEARRKQHTQEVHLDQGYPPGDTGAGTDRRRGHRGPDGPCRGARRRLLFAVLPLITH